MAHETADSPPPTGSIGLRWIGHATLLIEMDGQRILTDPVLRDRVGPLLRHGPTISPHWYAGLDLVLISHLHRDHLHLPSLRMLGHHVRMVVPVGAGPLLARAGFRDIHELAVGQTWEAGDLRVRATAANHSGFRPPSGPTAQAVGYVIQGSHSVYFAGDTDLFPSMVALRGSIDLALLPVGGWGPTLGPGHLDPARAAHALSLIRPRASVPIHWGTLWPIGLRWVRPDRFHSPARLFATHASALAPEVHIHLLRPGGSAHFPAPAAAESAASSAPA